MVATNGWLECTDEDRRARRRKLGLPEELTEEEKAQEAAAAAQKAEAAKKKNSFVTVKPVSGSSCLPPYTLSTRCKNIARKVCNIWDSTMQL